MWMAIIGIVGVLTGTAGGVLMWMGGTRSPLAIVSGGGCAITVMLFLIAVADFLAK
jgi:hypothetical protein